MLGVCFTIIDDENDKDKFEELYLKYRQRMYAIAYSILRNSHDAEDAVGQAFLSVANNFKKISLFSRQELEAYIVIIIRNTSINIFNQNKKRSERNTEMDDNISESSDILEKYEYKRVVEKISGLPESYKDVFLMYYVLGFSSNEIAEMFRISKSAVWKRLERGKKILKKELEDDEQYV